MPAAPTREEILSQAASEPWDLLVIGGGITGAGCAHLAARAGLRVLLVEKTDFAWGTSSRSSKLLHGGIRYLAQGRLHLVFEALRERNRLLQGAPARALRFMFPTWRGDAMPPWMLETGMYLYDFLSTGHSPGRHRFRGRDATLAAVPALKGDILRCSSEYFDALTDDSRLVMEELGAAARAGAHIVNHAELVSLGVHSGRVESAGLRDGLTGREITVRAASVINATGPWLERVMKLGAKVERPVLRLSKGVHLFTRARPDDPDRAVVMNDTRHKRILFFVPWKPGIQLLGTTETQWEGDLDAVHADAADVAYILENHARIFKKPLDRDELISAQAGLRPLLMDSSKEARTTSREHRILQERGSNFITIGGGKLTTFRVMAQQAVSRALACLHGRRFPPDWGRPGAIISETMPAAMPFRRSEAASFLAGHFGYPDVAARVSRLAAADAALADSFAGDARVPKALVHYFVLEEQARTLSDLMQRRTRLALTEPDGAMDLASEVSNEMVSLLGWSEEKRRAELAAYHAQIGPDLKAIRA